MSALAQQVEAWMCRPGQVFGGKYRLVKPIAQGATSEVWTCYHEMLKIEQAIKVVDVSRRSASGLADRAIERLRFEAQVSALLAGRTQHVIAVRDAGVVGQMAYLVMDRVAGRTLLMEIERRGGLDPSVFGEILSQLGDALDAAHESGIIHRDVKPSNVMLLDAPGGTLVKLVDFGIAKAIGPGPGLDVPRATERRLSAGSPSYMSPEQCMGLEHDHRSDIWALGVLAYQALTGTLPFTGETPAELAVGIIARTFVPPSLLRRKLPRALDSWFARALAKNPRARFRSVREMVERYHDALRPPKARRRYLARGAGALASILLLSFGAGRAAELDRTTAVSELPPSQASASTSPRRVEPSAALARRDGPAVAPEGARR